MVSSRGVCRLPVLFAITLALLCACGKRGALVPPEALVPAPVANLALAQKGGRIQVSWSAPSRQEGGEPLRDLEGFLLFRRTVLPPDQDCEECPGAYAQLARIDLAFPDVARKVGGLWIYDDFDLRKGRTYQYKVSSFTTEGAQSKDSNLARRTVMQPPLPPVLETSSSASEITLSFVALPPEEGKLVGYNIYRSKKGDELPLVPLNREPLTANTYQDKVPLFGTTYLYSVTTVADLNGEVAESAPSNVVEGTLLLPE